MRISTFLTGLGLAAMAAGFVMPVYGQTYSQTSVTETTSTTTPNGTTITSSKTTDLPAQYWNTQSTYWQQTFATRPYYRPGANYDYYRPAYQYGVSEYVQYNGRPYSEVVDNIHTDWDRAHVSALSWTEAEPVIRDAYNRMYNDRVALPSDTVESTAGTGSATTRSFRVPSSTGTAMGR